MILPTETTAGNLPINFSGTPDEFYKAFRNRLRTVVPDSKVLTGYNGVTKPELDLGPWIRPEPDFLGPIPPLEWWSWGTSEDKYVPMPVNVGVNSTYSVRLICNAKGGSGGSGLGSGTFLPDAGGTIALLYDIYVPRETKILSGASPILIRWSTAEMFIHRLTANATYTFSGLVDGNSILVSLQNNATAYTATFPGSIQWPGGTQPVQPVGSAGKNAVGLWRFWYINSTLYGDLEGSSAASPSPDVDTDPTETTPPTYGQPYINIPPHHLP